MSYNIENHSKFPSEFYIPEVPYIVSSDVNPKLNEDFSGYSWLYNSQNILVNISGQWNSQSESIISSFIKNDENNTYTGNCNLTIFDDITGNTCKLFGSIIFYPDYVSAGCYGYLTGYLSNDEFNADILVDAYCHGTVISSAITNEYFLSSLTGTCMEIKDTLSTSQYQQYVISTKNNNMLGRKTLSYNNPLFNIGLDKRPLNMDSSQRFMEERWRIEEIINDGLPPTGYLLKSNKSSYSLNSKLNSKLNFQLSDNINISPKLLSSYYVIVTNKTDNNVINGLKIVTSADDVNSILLRTSK